MLPFKKILCPTDFSEPSYEAVKTANELSLHFSSELYLVHVVNPIPIMTNPEIPTIPISFNVNSYMDALVKSAKNSLQQLIGKMVSKKLQVHPIVSYGEPANEIVSVANKEHIDLIVIASHGLTGWRHLIIGSVTDKVIRITSHPVLTIRAPKKIESL
jgi:nucleotide-binding universal stress UspA family protein